MTLTSIEEQVETIHLGDRRWHRLAGPWPAEAKLLALNFIGLQSPYKFKGEIQLGYYGHSTPTLFEFRWEGIGNQTFGLFFPVYVTQSMWPLKILASCKKGTKVDMQVDLQFYYEKGAE